MRLLDDPELALAGATDTDWADTPHPSRRLTFPRFHRHTARTREFPQENPHAGSRSSSVQPRRRAPFLPCDYPGDAAGSGNRVLPQLLSAAAVPGMAFAQRAGFFRPRPALRRLVRLPGRAGGPRQRGRTPLHRTLGWYGAGLAAAMVATGTYAALVAANRPTGFTGMPVPPLQFLAVPAFDILLFPAFVALAVVKRRDAQAHKRLMLLASVNLVAAAFARWPLVQ